MPFDTEQEARNVGSEREFYIFEFGDVPTEFYTSHRRPITESVLRGVATTWTPLPILRKGVKKTHRLSADTFKIILPVTNSFVSLVAQGGLDTVKVTIIRGFGADYTNDYRNPWLVGYLEDITVGTQTVSGNLKSVEGLFDDTFPKIMHQPGCNNSLFDDVCGLNPATYIITRTVTLVGNEGRLIEVDGAIPANDYYTLGRMRISGSSAIWRHITQQAGNQYVLHIPIVDLDVGDSVDILPGCGGDIANDCVAKFNNKANAVAMPVIPAINPIIDGF